MEGRDLGSMSEKQTRAIDKAQTRLLFSLKNDQELVPYVFGTLKCILISDKFPSACKIAAKCCRDLSEH
jgi:hypothetical protein